MVCFSWIDTFVEIKIKCCNIELWVGGWNSKKLVPALKQGKRKKENQEKTDRIIDIIDIVDIMDIMDLKDIMDLIDIMHLIDG